MTWGPPDPELLDELVRAKAEIERLKAELGKWVEAYEYPGGSTYARVRWYDQCYESTKAALATAQPKAKSHSHRDVVFEDGKCPWCER